MKVRSDLSYFGVLLSALILVSSAQAAFLDQSQTLSNAGVAFWTNRILAQTFTPSVTGVFDSVSLALSANNFGDESANGLIEPIHITIAEWGASGPQNLLGSAETYLTVPAPTAWTTLSFSSQNVVLTAGTQYAILFSNDLVYGSVNPYRNTGIAVQSHDNPYDRGRLWLKLNNDLNSGWSLNYYASTDVAFQTWMTSVPEPSTFLLLSVGLAGIAIMRCRRPHE